MSGHSKFANIKHKKGAADKKRSKEFGKMAKEIMVAAKMGGGDATSNPRLRNALIAARAVNLPKDNIERAIKKGIGELGDTVFKEVIYEGYGPGGVAIMVECLTDNLNRTVGDVRYIFDRAGGNMGASGSVAWMFSRKTEVIISAGQGDEDTLMEIVLDAGADDLEMNDDGSAVVYGAPDAYEAITKALEEKGIATEEAKVKQVPSTMSEISELEKAQSLMRLVDKLEDLDDVQSVYTNADIPDDIAEQLESE